MIGARHVELFGDLASGALGSGNGLVHAFFRTGNDGLAGTVEVGYVHIAFLRQLDDVLIGTADHGGHGALGGVAGFLHEGAAFLNQA